MPVRLRVMWISTRKENLKAFQQKRKHSDKEFAEGITGSSGYWGDSEHCHIKPEALTSFVYLYEE